MDRNLCRLVKTLSLDIGSARGRYILQMAQFKPDWNFLGLEIREPLVDRCNEVRSELGLKICITFL